MKPIGYEGEADRLKRSSGSRGLVSACPGHPGPPPGEVTTPRQKVQLKFHIVGEFLESAPRARVGGQMEADSWEDAARAVGGQPTNVKLGETRDVPAGLTHCSGRSTHGA